MQRLGSEDVAHTRDHALIQEGGSHRPGEGSQASHRFISITVRP
jgi:hypothetical protein